MQNISQKDKKDKMRKCLFELFQVLSKAFTLYAGSKGTTKTVMGTLMLGI